MTTKQAILWSLATFGGMLFAGILLIVLFIDMNGPGANARAEKLGSAMGVLCLIPSAVIWFRWAIAFRQAKERAAHGAKRKHKTPQLKE
ncbi:MAG: hypothetical protein DWH91_01380 [Planctomycetota bacterium]|nr:MAG: hypothetical protein DWH91_01380 [Planctomycetota bacterium]